MKGWVNLGALPGQNPAGSRRSLEWDGGVEQHPNRSWDEVRGRRGLFSSLAPLCLSLETEAEPQKMYSHLTHQASAPP